MPGAVVTEEQETKRTRGTIFLLNRRARSLDFVGLATKTNERMVLSLDRGVVLGPNFLIMRLFLLFLLFKSDGPIIPTIFPWLFVFLSLSPPILFAVLKIGFNPLSSPLNALRAHKARMSQRICYMPDSRRIIFEPLFLLVLPYSTTRSLYFVVNDCVFTALDHSCRS